jgi:hypothetical protein
MFYQDQQTSECAWVFQLLSWPAGKSLNEIKLHFEVQLSAEFVGHACANPSQINGSEPSSLARKAASRSKMSYSAGPAKITSLTMSAVSTTF